MKAWLNLRYTVPERLRAFVAGIERHGYRAEIGFPDRIGPRDCFITWNRINMGNVIAQKFQDQGLPVIVAEDPLTLKARLTRNDESRTTAELPSSQIPAKL